MPDEFLNKVIYLCRKISEVEWSGVLFYELKGSIQDPINAEIILKDILLMHKGTTGYTEYSFDESVVGFVMDNGYMKYKMGHIHSHAKLGVFFSGTDMDELYENSEFHNFYLSLIVNNVLDMTAKVAFRAKSAIDTTKVIYIAKDEMGKEYAIQDQNLNTELLCIYDCDILTGMDNIVSTFKDRTTEIIKIADTKTKSNTSLAINSEARKNIEFGFNDNDSPIWRGAETIDVDTIDLVIDDVYYEFGRFLLRLGNDPSEGDVDDDIEEVIESCMLDGMTELLPSSILEQYMPLYDKFYDGNMEAQSQEVFLDTLEKVIFVYEEFEEQYKWLSKLILALKSFATKISLNNLESIE